jgi:hypothetical protein
MARNGEISLTLEEAIAILRGFARLSAGGEVTKR